MRFYNSNQTCKSFAVAKSFLYLFSILLLLLSVDGNSVLANQGNMDQIQFVKPQDGTGNEDQIQATVFNNYLPLIMNGLPVPSEFNKNAPANGTTGTTLAPVLSWNVSTNATKYEYCYDTTNDGTCSTWISTGTNNYVGLWALQPATTYYWQARAWNETYGPTYANGSASAYWSFTTMVMAPGAFNKNAPASGSTGVSLSPVLSWNVSTNATKYEYCYDTTNDSTCSNWISTGTNNYVGLWALQPATTYYWQVRAWNETYGPTYANGSASAYWSFTTMVMVPGAFNKYAPANGTTGTTLAPVLSWNVSTNATEYEYCYDTTNDNACSNWISTGTNNYVGLWALQPASTYYWQVRAWNGTYGPTYANGSASAYWSFTTMVMAPGAFNKYAPASGSVGISLTPVLSWNVSANATRYEYCYDTSNDGTCSNWISTGTNNWVGLSGLQGGTTYYWQIRSWNGTYGPTYANGSASAYWNFSTVITAPGSFIKLGPNNGSEYESRTPLIAWTSSERATRYEYCYDTTNDGYCSNWIDVGSDTMVAMSSLNSSTKYYWQVRAWNGTTGPIYADGAMNLFWNFMTVDPNVWVLDRCTLYEDGYYFHFVCEIYNNTSSRIFMPDMTVNLLDSNQNLITTEFDFTDLWILHPNQTTCIDVSFIPPDGFSYLSIDSWSWYDEVYLETLTPTIVSTTGSSDGEYFNTVGFLRNDTTQTIVDPYAISTIYYPDGYPAGCGFGFASNGNLTPGVQTSFEVNILHPYADAIALYRVQAEGYPVNKASLSLPGQADKTRFIGPDNRIWKLEPNIH